MAEYDFEKYPAASYLEFRDSFSQLSPTPQQLEGALKWKWGHWRKQRFPVRHGELIRRIQLLWSRFRSAHRQPEPNQTFEWWAERLNRRTSYISYSYITHLIHHGEQIPMIDQHNYRGMNHLVASVRPDFQFKKRPSTWNDILELKSFMQKVCPLLPGLSLEDLDKLLMMYGRNHVQRNGRR